MGIMSVKKIIIFLLVIGVMAVVTGCSRWPDGPNGNGGTENYQLEITVEVLGEINTDDGIYYIVLDADGDSATGPGDDILFWDNRFYYIKLEDEFFDFAQVKDDIESMFDGGSFSGNKIQITIPLSDLEDPNSIDINVITTDSENNTYDHLDWYFTISTVLGSTGEGIISGGGTGGADFDITEVSARIITLY